MSDYIPILSEDFVKVESEIFFVAKYFNLIFKVDMKTSKITVVGSIPEENIFCERVASKIIYWKRKLFFIPMNAKKIWIYDLDNNSWQNIAIDEENIKIKFFQAVIEGNGLYLFGHMYPAIIYLNMDTYEIEYIKEPFAEIEKNKFKNKDCYFICEYVREQDWILIASSAVNKVLKFNLKTRQYKYVEIGKENNRYAGICKYDGKYVLAPRENGDIVIWDGEDKITEIPLPQEFSLEKKHFLGIVNNNNKLILAGMNEDSTLEVTLADTIECNIQKEHYVCYQQLEEDMIISEQTNGKLSIVKNGKDQYETNLIFDSKKLWEVIYKLYEKSDNLIINENPMIGIKDIGYLCELARLNKKENTKYGKEIWEKLK